MIDILAQASLYPAQFIICIIVAFIPAFIWMVIFLNKAEKDPFHLVLTFFFGMGSAGLILLYQSFWGDGAFNFIFFGVEAYDFKYNITTLASGVIAISFFTYLAVGFLEELLKHFVVVKADKSIFSSIDEVIELSIVAALGFAFLENIAYFYREFLSGGLSQSFWILSIQRSIFVVFIHVLCSAIYGYFYGMGFFAKPYMKYQIEKGKHFYIADFFNSLFNIKKSYIFRKRMMILGVIIASLLHGLYDFAMNINPTLTFFGTQVQLHVLLLPTMLVGGVFYLQYLLQEKVNNEEFGVREMEYIYTRPSELLGRNSRKESFRDISWA